MEINGVAHIRVNVDRFEDCVEFYDQLMPYLGLQVVHRSDQFVYYVGGRTGYYVARADEEHAGESNAPTGLGLDHICFRARSREDIDELFGFLKKIDARIVREPEEGPWAPGYYSLSFLDPEGIRLEVNHVPGKGVFAKNASFDPAPDYPLTGRRPPSASGNVNFVRSIFAAWEHGELRRHRSTPARRRPHAASHRSEHPRPRPPQSLTGRSSLERTPATQALLETPLVSRRSISPVLRAAETL